MDSLIDSLITNNIINTTKNTFVIIPAHNEQNHIQKVIREVKKYIPNIIVIDDGSNDLTSTIAKNEKVVVLKHKVNLGKGAALKTGCDYAILKGAEQMIVLDGDGQHEPKEIPAFLNALAEQDLVFSYRKENQAMPLVLKFGNQFINHVSRILFGVKIKDNQCGYRAFTAAAYKKIRWEATDYYLETEMVIKTSKYQLRYTQIPIETIYSDKYKGTTVMDGVKIVLKMLAWRLLR